MTEVDKFADAFRRGNTSVSVRGCYGRIVRTRADRPLALAEEIDRRIVMVMGPGALKSLIGCSGYDMLSAIGYTSDYIERKLGEGFAFALLVFARPSGWLKIANWHNTITGISREYPELSAIMRDSAKALKGTSFADFQSQAGFEFADIDRAGMADPRFMTLDRLLASDRSALSVRRFLYHTARLSELYTGTGLTMTDGGKTGLREYVMANRPVSQLDELQTLTLRVELPGKPDARSCNGGGS